MGMLQDIIELIKDVKNNKYLDADEINGTLNVKFGKNSIARKAGHAILQFPVLTTNAISIDELTMVNKALEREYATFVRIAMSLQDSVESTEEKGDYLKRFHQNMGTKSQLRMNGNYFDESASLIAQNKLVAKPFLEDLRTDILNSKTNSNNMNRRKTLSENDGGMNVNIGNPTNNITVNTPSPTNNANAAGKGRYGNQLIDNDVKKANELVPTTLEIGVLMQGKDGKPTNSSILMGVKTIAHLINSEQMIYNLAKGVEEKRGLFRAIQWTTGEIAFFKDYLFMIDRIKNDATSQRTNSHWWNSLKRRARESKLRRMTFGKKELLPNATIVITMDEVEYIANNYNIDLVGNIKAVQTLMDVFFLLGFVIVDSASELAYFFFDGQTTYQTFSYNALERENSNANNTRDAKSLITLMNNR